MSEVQLERLGEGEITIDPKRWNPTAEQTLALGVGQYTGETCVFWGGLSFLSSCRISLKDIRACELGFRCELYNYTRDKGGESKETWQSNCKSSLRYRNLQLLCQSHICDSLLQFAQRQLLNWFLRLFLPESCRVFNLCLHIFLGR